LLLLIEWFLSAQAIVRIGASIATLYATLGDDGIVHGINETEVTHIVTTQDLLSKLAKIKDKIPKVTTIIYIEGIKPWTPNGFGSDIKLVPFTQLVNAGKAAPEDLTGVPPNEEDTAVILYTSGIHFSNAIMKKMLRNMSNF